MPSIRELAKGYTMESAETLVKDASYIPEEMLDWQPMDFGKSVNSILSECARANLSMAAALTGNESKEMASTEDFKALKDCVVDSAQEVANAIDSLSDEVLEGDTQMHWGAVMPTAAAMMLPASHMNYHDGQVNYIQLLLGDTKFHWHEE